MAVRNIWALWGCPVVLTGSVPPVPQFPRAGAVIWPGSQPGLRGLNSCFVPAVLLRRCSGKANIPRPGVYRLAAPSLLPPARGTGRGAAPVPGGDERGCSTSVLSPLSWRSHGATAGTPLLPPLPQPRDAPHPSAFTPCPRSVGRADPRGGPGDPPSAEGSPLVWPRPRRVLPRSWAGVRGRGAVRRAFLTYLRALRASGMLRRWLRGFTTRQLG